MAEKADNSDRDTPPEETPSESEEQGSEPVREQAEADAPAAQAPGAAEAEADAPAGEQAEADAPAGEADGGAPAPRGEPEEQISPKERRRRARSRHVGEASPQRSPEQRHAERLALRRAKAARRGARRSQERVKAAGRVEARQRSSAAAEGSEADQLAPVHAAAAGKRKVRQGIVVSDKAAKTIVVRIDIARPHRRYEKIVRSSSTLHAHDESNDARVGDMVRVIESRPLSRTKRWKLIEVLERAQ